MKNKLKNSIIAETNIFLLNDGVRKYVTEYLSATSLLENIVKIDQRKNSIYYLQRDIAVLTALMNDLGEDYYFTRELDAYAQEDDLVIIFTDKFIGNQWEKLLSLLTVRKLNLLLFTKDLRLSSSENIQVVYVTENGDRKIDDWIYALESFLMESGY